MMQEEDLDVPLAKIAKKRIHEEMNADELESEEGKKREKKEVVKKEVVKKKSEKPKLSLSLGREPSLDDYETCHVSTQETLRETLAQYGVTIIPSLLSPLTLI